MSALCELANQPHRRGFRGIGTVGHLGDVERERGCGLVLLGLLPVDGRGHGIRRAGEQGQPGPVREPTAVLLDARA